MNSGQVFKQIIREGNFDNTYKMAWAKALVELANEQERLVITLDEIAHKFIKYYWNQTIFFDLKQGPNPNKPPVIPALVKNMIDLYQSCSGKSSPEFYQKASTQFKKLGLQKEHDQLVRKVKSTLKQDVSWRFLRLKGETKIQLYTYQVSSDRLTLSSELFFFLQQNEQDLYELINYRFAMLLEGFNHCPRIYKKIAFMDYGTYRRASLTRFHRYLDLENPDHQCFICQKQIPHQELSLDHVIPWSYLYADDLWNLVYVCRSCNARKNNHIPSKDEIEQLNDRNKRLLYQMEQLGIQNKMIEELRLAIEQNYAIKFWIGCRNEW